MLFSVDNVYLLLIRENGESITEQSSAVDRTSSLSEHSDWNQHMNIISASLHTADCNNEYKSRSVKIVLCVNLCKRKIIFRTCFT